MKHSKPFKQLKNKMSATAQAAAEKKTQQLMLRLQELRQARHLSQERLAQILKTKQANVSRLERRTDMYISTLRTYIEAMGGELDIIARFPDGEIHVTQFSQLSESDWKVIRNKL